MYTQTKHSFPLRSIRKSKWTKAVSLLLVSVILSEAMNPLQAFALTSGPTQPEAESFTPVDAGNLVSPFTGDFSYNVPLIDIGGYPINLAYQSGVTMEQEATWAGLGWNVNVGSITRQMRGVPDEFWGDEITKELNMKDNFTVGANVGISFEAFGVDPDVARANINLGVDISYNNYKGFNLGTSVAPSIGTKKGAAFGTNFSLGVSSSLDGMNISPNLSFSKSMADANNTNVKAGVGIGLNMNSRTGLSNLTLSHSIQFDNNLCKTHFIPNTFVAVSGSMGGSSGSHTLFGGSIGFAGTSYTPQIDFPFETGAFTGTFKIGAAAWGGDFDLKVGGYGSLQRLKKKTLKTPAYGYFYEEKANGKDDAIMDFNREKDGAFTEFTPALPLTVHTNDVFSINAHGLTGSFRGFRNDLGFVHDNRMKTTNFDFTTGFELNSASLLNAGFDAAANTVLSESKAWRQDNKAEPFLRGKENEANKAKENFYLKITGEPTITTNPGFENETGNDQAVQIPFENTYRFNTKLDNKIKFRNGGSSNLNAEKQREIREPRNVSISYLTAKEAKNVSPRRQKYLSPLAKDHHIAEITVVHPDGKRYVFGLAAYNKTQREVTFSVGAGKFGTPAGVSPAGPYSNEPTPILPGIASMASTDNAMGIDQYFDATTTPAYVHTWFLTEVYSPDYVDVTGDGPSVDDAGDYVLFNYGEKLAGGQIVPDIADFRWKTPTSANSASLNKGLYSDPTDDKANYIYGVKEVYFLHSVESKNQVAEFVLKERQDGFGVTGEFGGPGGTALKAIDKIMLFTREEYESNRVPSKTIHFDYDYSLCPSTPNSHAPGGGKLTLRRVWFTYRNSARSKFSHYSFTYDSNAPYTPNRYTDRWGNYKPNESNLNNGPDNSEFPYVTQNTRTQKDSLAAYAKMWNLTEIGLPTGGSIQVEYEPDDYAYVQDRKAARMFKIIGTAEKYDDSRGNRLFTKTPGGVKNHNFLFFELEQGTENMSDQELINAYLPHTYSQKSDYIYYRFFSNMNNGLEYSTPGSLTNKKEEYVSGYAEVDRSDPHFMGKLPGGIGYIKVKSVPVSDKPGGVGSLIQINPIAKAAWQFSRIHTPKYAFNQPDPDDTEFEVIIKLLAAADLVSQMTNMFKGPNVRMLEHGFGSYFDNKRSWIRLNDPDGQKFGGGSRVKSITVNDNWADMEATESSSSYTQEFSYKNADNTSSGVASYEPMIGADENPFREPVFYEGKKNLLIPADGFYQETPYGETFFPSPVVGYSRVVTKDRPIAGSSNSGTGFKVQEFYTAKDYPTLCSQTAIDPRRQKTNPVLALLKIDMKDYMRASQGFVIELNDMHGKPKSQKIYGETASATLPQLISSEEYIYFDTPLGNRTRKVDNSIPVVDEKGRISTKRMATEYDLTVDMREQKTRVYNVTVAGNLAYFQNGPVPALVPTVFPGFSKETTLFRSAVTTKVIYKYGMLKETVVTDLGSRVSKKNVAFDPLTGDPLLVQVNSEFEDPQYSLTMPARWMYPGMGAAYQNIGYYFVTDASSFDYGTGRILTNSDPDKYLFPGDELAMFGNMAIRRGSANIGNEYQNRYWVAADNTGRKFIIDQYGSAVNIPVNLKQYFKVIRSGRRNINATPAQQTVSLKKPVNTAGTLLELNGNKQILSSSATTFSEQWAVNSFNRSNTCEMACEMDDISRSYVTLMNRLLDAGVLGDSVTRRAADFVNIFETASLDSCPDLTATTQVIPGTPFHALTIYLGNCDGLTCKTLPVLVHPRSPIQEDIFAHMDRIAYFSAQAIDRDCDNPIPDFENRFLITAVLKDGRQMLLLGDGQKECIVRKCSTRKHNCMQADNPVNPYIYGILGNWRPRKSLSYLCKRVNQSLDEAADVRGGGYYENYVSFWTVPANVTDLWLPTTQQTPAAGFWQWVSETTAYGISGADVENRDPVSYSAAVYGYHNLLPTAVAKNARYREIAYDGFEDYYSRAVTNECYKDHFRFEAYINSVVTEAAHTGKYSLKVPAQTTYATERTLLPAAGNRETRNVPYVLESTDFLGLYSPPLSATYKFVVSFWAKPDGYFPEEFDYAGIGMTFTLNGSNHTVTPVKTKRVEGWQKFEYTFTGFTLPGGTNTVSIGLNNTRGEAVYFDDLRIHPFDANMKSFVYDLNTLKTMAELDENNFATFYEYDEDGSLVRVKKETERGIMTLREHRKSSVKKTMN